jgi:amidase
VNARDDDPLGAFVPGARVTAEPTGSGPLDGLSFAAKDVFDVAGHRTGFGNPTWLETHEPAPRTAPAIERLLAAGARLVGKAVSDELTYSLTGANVHYGTPLNPRCPDRVPGGSSSGSASAVAGGAVDFALGSDCAGSVRIPSSYCGILGMRPTHGRIPLECACPFAPSFDTAGWMARDADVLERAGRALLADDAEAPPARRLLVAEDAFGLVEPRVAEALAPGVDRVEKAIGAAREQLVVAPEGLGAWMEQFRVVQGFEIWRSLGAWVEQAKPQLGPGIRERLDWARTIDARAADEARARIAAIGARLHAMLPADAVLCLPTAPQPAPLKEGSSEEVENRVRYQAISLLSIANLGGLPQLTLPLGELDGAPLGLSLVAARDADTMLLALARRIL